MIRYFLRAEKTGSFDDYFTYFHGGWLPAVTRNQGMLLSVSSPCFCDVVIIRWSSGINRNSCFIN